MAISKNKESGRIYTPEYIVKNILDLSEYNGVKILKKHIIDNSCGDGAFLQEIVRRYCQVALSENIIISEIVSDLQYYIHGIELDFNECQKCNANLNAVIKKYGIASEINWDIVCGDALKETKYDNKMDFVVGNPPYVRIHNLGDRFKEVKNQIFNKKGMTDLYLLFFEIGLRMLNKFGTLGYITPSSYFSSVAGGSLRKYLVINNLLHKVVDLKHFQPFEATTYTAISILKKDKSNNDLDYYDYDEQNLVPRYVDTIRNQNYYIADNFYFGNMNELSLLESIFYNFGNSEIEVKNGYATLCDDVFINDFPFDSQYILPVIKASTGDIKKMFYPYGIKADLIDESILEQEENMYRYLCENKQRLLNRSVEKKDGGYWYAFGRSQAIKDTYKEKLSINSLLRDAGDWKMIEAPAGVGVYSGLYIISYEISIEEIKASLKSDDFISYVRLLGKYKSGGYYTFSTKDVKAYLNYKFAYNGGLFGNG